MLFKPHPLTLLHHCIPEQNNSVHDTGNILQSQACSEINTVVETTIIGGTTNINNRYTECREQQSKQISIVLDRKKYGRAVCKYLRLIFSLLFCSLLPLVLLLLLSSSSSLLLLRAVLLLLLLLVVVVVLLLLLLFLLLLLLLLLRRLDGLVVKVSASRAEGPGFESRLRRDFFGVESYQ